VQDYHLSKRFLEIPGEFQKADPAKYLLTREKKNDC
jgi:hypothetical protein